jgi:hypothetical protein
MIGTIGTAEYEENEYPIVCGCTNDLVHDVTHHKIEPIRNRSVTKSSVGRLWTCPECNLIPWIIIK